MMCMFSEPPSQALERGEKVLNVVQRGWMKCKQHTVRVLDN